MVLKKLSKHWKPGFPDLQMSLVYRPPHSGWGRKRKPQKNDQYPTHTSDWISDTLWHGRGRLRLLQPLLCHWNFKSIPFGTATLATRHHHLLQPSFGSSTVSAQFETSTLLPQPFAATFARYLPLIQDIRHCYVPPFPGQTSKTSTRARLLLQIYCMQF